MNEEELAKKDEEAKNVDLNTPKSKEMYKAIQVAQLKGHTETVEFCKFDASGKWLVTGGMNNLLRVWDVEAGFALKQIID